MGRIGLLFGLIAIALILMAWYSRTNTARQKWLASLELPGSWAQDAPKDGQDPVFLSFNGEHSKGTYEFRQRDEVKQGTWRISQSSLILSEASGDEFTYEIRYFDKGKIGLDGENLDHQTFSKQTDNIVPLRRT